MSNKPLRHVLSFSGGKDSTALWLEMTRRQMPIDEVIFADTGMEYPELHLHLARLQEQLQQSITIVRSEKTYYDYLLQYGHPNIVVRWCTKKLKLEPIETYLKRYKETHEVIQYIGFSYDEVKRKTRHLRKGKNYRYPLIDWKMTDEDCLQYCYDHGFTWDGLYNDISRMNCWCCPLQDKRSLRALYEKRPELWEQLRQMDKMSKWPFKHQTVQEWEDVFNSRCEPYSTVPTMYIKGTKHA